MPPKRADGVIEIQTIYQQRAGRNIAPLHAAMIADDVIEREILNYKATVDR